MMLLKFNQSKNKLINAKKEAHTIMKLALMKRLIQKQVLIKNLIKIQCYINTEKKNHQFTKRSPVSHLSQT